MLRIFLSRARRAPALLSAAILVTTSACSDSSAAPRASVNVVGTYALSEVDGVELPAEIHSAPYLDPASQHLYNEFVVNLTDAESSSTRTGP
jgi:hypothetical protein